MCDAIRSGMTFLAVSFGGALLWGLLFNVVAAEDPARTTGRKSEGVAGAEINHVERFASVTAFVKLLGESKDVRLCVGVRRLEVGEREGDNYKGKEVVDRKGFKFLAQPRSVSGDRLRILNKSLTGADVFAPFAGPKFCGGFHPDYLLEWKRGGKHYQALFCFGCHEIRWFEADDYEVWCDMTESGAKTLKETLRQVAELKADE